MKGISRRGFLDRVGRAVAGLAGPALLLRNGVAAAQAENGVKPNFVFILIDDLGWCDVGCYGNTVYETPNVDRLAREGMRFTEGYAACCCCSPTRASILTGKYPARLHLTDWIPGSRDWPWPKLRQPNWRRHLALEEVTIAEALRPAGYTSASIGKWHLGGPRYRPEAQGFDLNFGGSGRGCPPSYFYPYRLPGIKGGKPGEYLTDRLTDEALRFIEGNRRRPFFLYLSYYTVHRPLQAKRDKIAKYRARGRPARGQHNATHAAMVESMDENIGRVLAKLDELKLADRTVIVFMSDNGGLTRKFEGAIFTNAARFVTVTSNAPLRQGKGAPYDGGIREPWIVRWPGAVEPGTTCNVPVTSVDFYPTILDMAAVKDIPGHVVDGVSIVPLLKQRGGLDRQAIYWHYPHYNTAAEAGVTPHGIVRAGRYKLIEFYEDARVELYDLETDIGEKQDLATQMPQKAAELRKMLHDWLKAVGAQMPTPNPNYDPAKANEVFSRWRNTPTR